MPRSSVCRWRTLIVAALVWGAAGNHASGDWMPCHGVDPLYLDATRQPRLCVYSPAMLPGIGEAVLSSPDKRVIVRKGASTRFAFVYYHDYTPYCPGYQQPVYDDDYWQDPNQAPDVLETWGDWSNFGTVDAGETSVGYACRIDHVFHSTGDYDIRIGVRDLGIPCGGYVQGANDGPNTDRPTPGSGNESDFDLVDYAYIRVVDDSSAPPAASMFRFDISDRLHPKYSFWAIDDQESTTVRYETWITDASNGFVAGSYSCGFFRPGRQHDISVTLDSELPAGTYFAYVLLWNGVGLTTGTVSNDARVYPFSFTPSGWTMDGDNQTLRYAGGGAPGSAVLVCPVAYDDPDNPNDPENPGNEYEISYTVDCTALRPPNGEWPTPWMQIEGLRDKDGIAQVYSTRRFFGDDVDGGRKRRVRFAVTPDEESVTIRFASDSNASGSATITDLSFRPVGSITQRETGLTIPYTGYNLFTPPGGGCIDGWLSGYNDTDMQAWIDSVKETGRSMLVRAFVNLDQGFYAFDDDVWHYCDPVYDPNSTDTTLALSRPDAQYQDDPPPIISQGPPIVRKPYAWVTRSGTGYDNDSNGDYKGFHTDYVNNIRGFLDKCQDNNIKVLAVLYTPVASWRRLPALYGSPVPEPRMPAFRKTTFDRTGDTMVYQDQTQKYMPGVNTQDHSLMTGGYIQAIYDWLEVCERDAQGTPYTSLWGIDVMNEPLSTLGYPNWIDGGVTYYSWHGLGWSFLDNVESTRRIRTFLEDAYVKVKDWARHSDHPLEVVCDIESSAYLHPKQFIDMAHPWDTSDPNTVHKVCDVFGLHWYQLYDRPPGSDHPLVDYSNPAVLLWTSDKIDNRVLDDDDQQIHGITVCPQTEWMAEKDVILSETVRYYNGDSSNLSVETSDHDGDAYFEADCLDWWCCNDCWYPKHLEKGKQRHLQSYIFWSGDGGTGTQHLVQGLSADTVVQPPFRPYDNASFGWRRFPPTDPYNPDLYGLGFGGLAVRSYDPDTQ